MAKKFTRGQWYISDFPKEEGTFIYSKDFPHGAIIRCYPPNGAVTTEKETRANARLCATAPDMLEALLIAKKAWEVLAQATGEEGLLSEDVAYQSMMQAIKKATE